MHARRPRGSLCRGSSDYVYCVGRYCVIRAICCRCSRTAVIGDSCGCLGGQSQSISCSRVMVILLPLATVWRANSHRLEPYLATLPKFALGPAMPPAVWMVAIHGLVLACRLVTIDYGLLGHYELALGRWLRLWLFIDLVVLFTGSSETVGILLHYTYTYPGT